MSVEEQMIENAKQGKILTHKCSSCNHLHLSTVYYCQKCGSKGFEDKIACLGVFGPKSRNLMSKLSKDDLSNESFKFGTAKKIIIDDKQIWAQRLSYVGELGWEGPWLFLEK